MTISQKEFDYRTDSLTRRLYANDASMYEELPKGVAFPHSTADIKKVVEKAVHKNLSITARSGGTSLAGQATGGGIVMDVSRHMTRIINLDADKNRADVEPGVIRDTLNREAAAFNLQFGPDTSTTNRCMIGGMIGNNSCGSFSIKHKTTREHALEMDVVLSDGSMATFKPLTKTELEHKKSLDNLEGHIYRSMLSLLERNQALIQSSYPHSEIIRRNTGYALDRLLEMEPFTPGGRPFNLCELLCGSEGTLALTGRAVLNLVPVDPYQLMIVPQFESLQESLEATVEAVQYEPAAVELTDHYILEATKGNIEQRKNRFFLEGDPNALLMIQFEGQSMEELEEKARALISRLKEKSLGYAFPILREHNKMKRAWDLRKAGLGLLMGMKQDAQTPSFVEDTAVRVQDLPAYAEEFQNLLDRYDTQCVFYAHVSVGEMHLRPIINLREEGGIEKMKNMAADVADLVKKFGGSLSGEHGDGRARAPYIEKVLGEEMVPILKQVKEIWDPNYMFNPGKIVDAQPIDKDLRYTPETPNIDVETAFKWRKEGGFDAAIGLCNGAGVCRKLADSGGTMCPSYMATKDEKDSTRGRANVFRQVFFERKADAFDDEDIRKALDLCLSCKACKSECPANVDMAKMKAEFMHRWQKEKGVSASANFFGTPERLYPLASLFAGLVNVLGSLPPSKWIAHKLFNIHPDRDLPKFASQTFFNWYQKNEASQTNGNKTDATVVLLVDIFTNFHDPDIAKSALHVLEKLEYRVIVPGYMASGRPQISKGLLDKANDLFEENIERLIPFIEKGIPIIGLEPSEILTLRDEYTDMASEEQLDTVKKLATQTYLFEEFINKHINEQPDSTSVFGHKGASDQIYLHGHCHAKALTGTDPLIECLQHAGYAVDELETGCCGMAGSFGYEANHYELSMNIGELTLFPALREINGNGSGTSDQNGTICAPGFSCRHQIKDGVNMESHHPAVLMEQALR